MHDVHTYICTRTYIYLLFAIVNSRVSIVEPPPRLKSCIWILMYAKNLYFFIRLHFMHFFSILVCVLIKKNVEEFFNMLTKRWMFLWLTYRHTRIQSHFCDHHWFSFFVKLWNYNRIFSYFLHKLHFTCRLFFNWVRVSKYTGCVINYIWQLSYLFNLVVYNLFRISLKSKSIKWSLGRNRQLNLLFMRLFLLRKFQIVWRCFQQKCLLKGTIAICELQKTDFLVLYRLYIWNYLKIFFEN